MIFTQNRFAWMQEAAFTSCSDTQERVQGVLTLPDQSHLTCAKVKFLKTLALGLKTFPLKLEFCKIVQHHYNFQSPDFKNAEVSTCLRVKNGSSCDLTLMFLYIAIIQYGCIMHELRLLQWLALCTMCVPWRCGLRETDIYPWQAQSFLLMPRPYKHIKQKPPRLASAQWVSGGISERAAGLFNYFLGKREEVRWKEDQGGSPVI